MASLSELPAALDVALRQIGVIPRKGGLPPPPPRQIDWSFKGCDGEPDF